VDTRERAEQYFRNSELYCSESIIHTINESLGFPYDKSITKLASGFPIGVGRSGCLCGAVSGGIMALGLLYGRRHGEKVKDDVLKLSADLHNYIKELYGSTCCRVLTKNMEFNSPERKRHCIKITGDVTEWVAGKMLEHGLNQKTTL